MKQLILFLSLILMISCSTDKSSDKQKWAIAIHGGAGTITKEGLKGDIEKQYIESLQKALETGKQVLNENGTSIDAVEKVIRFLENDSLFNAGKGAVLTNSETVEMDASIMDGATLNAGAVAAVTNIKNPISAARLVMEKSPHVMLIGNGAQIYAENNGIEMVDKDYFITKKRKEQLLNRKKKELDKHGTVGVVALDINGNLAAGTSTGGMTNKKHGRVGDSPIIGAGTYADNNSCAVSCTGHGEFFMRLVIAYEVSSLMKHEKQNIKEAANKVIHSSLEKLGGTGGLIALDPSGNYAMPFNTAGMFRAYGNSSGENFIKLYK